MSQIATDWGVAYPVEEHVKLSQLVVETVAEAEGVDPLALPPLHSEIDPDALDALFQPRLQSTSGLSVGEVQFSYHGYTVRITGEPERGRSARCGDESGITVAAEPLRGTFSGGDR